MQRKIYYTQNGQPEESIEAGKALMPTDSYAVEAVADALGIVPAVTDQPWDSPRNSAPTISDLLKQALERENVIITRVE